MTNYDYLATCRYYGPPAGYTHTASKKKYIAIHNTSNDATAQEEASYAIHRTDSNKTSTHFYVDKKEVIQSLDTTYQAWHAGSSQGNTYAIAIEFCGFNDKSRQWWMDNINWPEIIDVVYHVCADTGISVRHLSVDEMRAGFSTGFVTHNDMRLAWGGTTHTDPGSNFPLDYLIDQVNAKFHPTDPVGNPTPPPSGNGDPIVTNWNTLQKGQTGYTVKSAQALLNTYGAGLVEDGDFGPATESATKKFQGDHGLAVDGKFGPKTLSMALYRKVVEGI
jgi:N-acetyl-anhydromuramyl-L-alanine amidase AmpD